MLFNIIPSRSVLASCNVCSRNDNNIMSLEMHKEEKTTISVKWCRLGNISCARATRLAGVLNTEDERYALHNNASHNPHNGNYGTRSIRCSHKNMKVQSSHYFFVSILKE